MNVDIFRFDDYVPGALYRNTDAVKHGNKEDVKSFVKGISKEIGALKRFFERYFDYADKIGLKSNDGAKWTASRLDAVAKEIESMNIREDVMPHLNVIRDKLDRAQRYLEQMAIIAHHLELHGLADKLFDVVAAIKSSKGFMSFHKPDYSKR